MIGESPIGVLPIGVDGSAEVDEAEAGIELRVGLNKRGVRLRLPETELVVLDSRNEIRILE